MADSESSPASFSRQVLSKAWFSTWKFFEDMGRDAALFTISVVGGGIVYYTLHGLPAELEQIVEALIFTVGPVVVLWLLLFTWHLWLSPAALLYEQAKSLTAQKRSPGNARLVSAIAPKPVNWSVWKKLDTYTLAELASILAKRDPGGSGGSSEEHAFKQLLSQETYQDRLPIATRETDFKGETTDGSQVLREEAIKWADAQGFDLSHIK